MTVTAPADNETQSPEPKRYARPRGPFGGYVATRVVVLQEGYLREESFAIAALARLRGVVGREPGEDFTILEQTRVAEKYLGDRLGDDPTHTERAMHTALTLYAVHQQSLRDTPMHQDGIGLGGAVSLLCSDPDSAVAVRRRFAALGTATSYAAVTTHLRSLIRLLRDHRIALDYGVLAEDLARLQKPWGPAQVRGLWGRDFYRQPEPGDRRGDDSTDSKADSAPAGATSEE
ncbi:type I-E CRISPR-associated protein Cse2/CasB [Micromonospora sp. PTRAS2]|uniref:type I-E CRISPR-associated protein Cse2/CasB n=1 Tax=Micromonospora TaxID=1873 RepID=UPI00098D40ED|nr:MULTISPECIES: type I-E CRISPR-associated protein Cse2/CasB [unclassified Micromonospora]MDI5938533.1 type I-E CRISPR-associated protein Cse2/CasB [Micromonospora sp. DH15]OON32674.1 type I-E CRISPR-associated protein Cse2/CasB [Micromonospora sp. Rc5]